MKLCFAKPRWIQKPSRLRTVYVKAGIMDHMSENAVKCIVLSQIHTRYYNSPVIESEHLLLGIMSLHEYKDEIVTEDHINKPLFTNLPTFTIKNVKKGVEELFGRQDSSTAQLPDETTQLLFSEEMRHILYLANKERELRGAEFITPESILLMMVSLENKCRAMDVLKHIQVDISLLRDILYKDLKNDAEPLALSYNRSSVPTNVLDLCRDLCDMAHDKKIDPVFGRDKEINRLIQILCRRQKCNPLILGKPGVGKTAIVEGLAYKIVHTPYELPVYLWDKRILQLDIAGLMAGTSERGELEKRITDLLKYLKSKEGKVILMIDEIHTLIGSGGGTGTRKSTGDSDGFTIANLLKPALTKGDFVCIGATTYQEYSMYLQNDPAFDRRFQPLFIEEPSIPDSISILRGLKPIYEKFHNCIYQEEALEAAVLLSSRYLPYRQLPDKAIDLIDEAGSMMRMNMFGPAIITKDIIKKVITNWTDIPILDTFTANYDPITEIENNLKQKIYGQDNIIELLMSYLRRSKVDIRDPKRPIASLLFVGPSGVGKTELVKQLAKEMFGIQHTGSFKKRSFIHLDMSEYMDSFNISRLIGAPPGYVGFEDDGKLTEAVKRNPYCIVLFDEIEKAHPNISNILLQIFDEGCLTDAKGKKVSFKNTLIILTSNLGNTEATDQQRMKAIQKFFKPELINRMDEIVMFKPLDHETIIKIINKTIEESIHRIKEKGYDVLLSNDTLDEIYKMAENTTARGVRQIVSKYIEDKVTDYILSDPLQTNLKFML
jgi:ATP-dependent Clp protease ATP-binding subunit ClpC